MALSFIAGLSCSMLSTQDKTSLLPAREQAPDWKLTLLNNKTGPVCLDGSQPGWFERRSRNTKNQGKWVLLLGAGSMCHTNDFCQQRVSGDDEDQRSMGGSGNWAASPPREIAVGTSCKEAKAAGHEVNNVQLMTCADETLNPDFHDWNHVFFPYCSGDMWLGQAEEKINPWSEVDGPDDMRPFGGPSWIESNDRIHDEGFDGGGDDSQKYWFQGHLILRQLIEAWSGAGANATEVIVVGCSSAGSAVHYHADYFKEALPQARVSSLAMAAWFGALDEKDEWSVVVDGEKPRNKANGSDGWIMHTNPYVPRPVAACDKDLGVGLHDCYQVARMHPYSKADIFVVDSFNDPIKLIQGCQHEAEMCRSGAFPDWQQDAGNDLAIYQDAAGAKIRQSLDSTLAAKPNDGFFVTSCFIHCIDYTDITPQGAIRVDGSTVQEAFRRWYFNESGETRLIDASNDPYKEACGDKQIKRSHGNGE